MRQKLGELLIDLNLISQDTLDKALEEQKRSNERLGSTLLKMEVISEEDLDSLLSKQLDVPSINLENYSPDPEIIELIPEKMVRKHMVLPIAVQGRVLTVATANPKDLSVLDDLSYTTGYRLVPLVTSVMSLEKKINELYAEPVDWEASLKIEDTGDLEIIKPDRAPGDENLEKAIASAGEALVVKLVNAVILAAIEKEATHIHIEPKEDDFEIYLRIKGKLRLLVKPPAKLFQNVLNRIKILGSIDIINRLIPCEGYFRARSVNNYYDIDVATIPSMHGERMVLTFQQPFSKEELKLEKLGFTHSDLETVKGVLRQPGGFVLITGQADSGKSSTIYAALNYLKNPDRSIFTLERKIKNKLSSINQGEPNEKAGYSYEKGLQSLLRQDMDILMVGEMLTRDAIVSALIASLSKTTVFGRFLTNDTIGSLSMILDMDVPPFMLYSALSAIIGHRLVRRLCQECIEDYDPPEDLAREITEITGKENPKLFRSRGCKSCGFTGYHRRIGLFEIVVPSTELREAIFAREPLNRLKEVASEIKYNTFRQDGLIKAAEGLTSYEEIISVI